ncbi:MAG: TIR domain-containing protein [Bacteriovoracaceae bacterium]|nr:TIR domain-containing protein [Bacteriovoracaceae bacterium]
MSNHVVFLSYSSKDFDIAKKVLEYLENNGIECWMAPRNITPGEHYASAILEAIKTSKVFFLLFSPYSDSSEQCLKEVDRAVNARLPIVPFRIVDHVPTEAMEYYLCNTHWLDAFAKPSTEYFPEILRTCQMVLSGKSSEVVVPSRPQKPKEEMSEGMRAMLDRLESEAEKDVEEGKRFRNSQRDEDDPDKTAPMKNPFHKDQKPKGLQSIEGGKVDRTYAPKVEAKKKKPALKVVEPGKAAPKVEQVRKKRKIEFNSPDEVAKATKKKKSPLTMIFILVLFGGGGILFLKDKTDSKKKITTVSENIRKMQKAKDQAPQSDPDEINYEYISTKVLDKNDLTFKSENELEKLRSMILAKNGDLFEKQGSNLVEKLHNRFEINNLAVIDSKQHEKRVSRLKSVQSQNLDLDKKFPVIYFEPSSFKDDRRTEGSWILHNVLMVSLVRNHRVISKTTKNYPDQEEWNPTYLREKGNIVVNASLDPEGDSTLKVKIIDNGRSKLDFEMFKSGLQMGFQGQLENVLIKLEMQETREVPKIEISLSLGENMKEIQESKGLKEIIGIISESFSALVRPIN